VTRCAASDISQAVNLALGSARAVVVPEGLPPEFIPPTRTVTADTGEHGRELDRFDAVVTGSALAIAETGTVVLDGSADQGRRALTLVPDLHVCIVRASSVLLGVPEAIARISPERPQTWISGPSATSDIELDRVEGVHGPRTLHVVLVTDA
jgi:L-lactate dehydrogenase complex protein LldG